jgi:hypothetical protein
MHGGVEQAVVYDTLHNPLPPAYTAYLTTVPSPAVVHSTGSTPGRSAPHCCAKNCSGCCSTSQPPEELMDPKSASNCLPCCSLARLVCCSLWPALLQPCDPCIRQQASTTLKPVLPACYRQTATGVTPQPLLLRLAAAPIQVCQRITDPSLVGPLEVSIGCCLSCLTPSQCLHRCARGQVLIPHGLHLELPTAPLTQVCLRAGTHTSQAAAAAGR